MAGHSKWSKVKHIQRAARCQTRRGLSPDSAVASGTTAAQVPKPCEALDDRDDTRNVYANFDVPEDILAWLDA